MRNLKTIENRVLAVLKEHPEARNDDMKLYLLVSKACIYDTHGISHFSFEDVMSNYKAYGIPCFESIRRTRQKIQAKYPELGCSPEVRRASIINADMNFDLRGIPITPENNFFIQGFMGMVWFMIPASLVICTVLLNQTERSNKGILKMLSLPISTTKLCLAKFTVLILLAAFQMVMSIGAYYICAAIVTHTQDYNFILEPLYVCKNVCSIYAAAIPMAAVYLAVSTLIQSPIFSVGIGLASIVPSVLMINTKIWFAYPMSYPFYLIMVAYGRAAEGVYETQIAWLPWLPVAVGITILALVVSCMRYGASERR